MADTRRALSALQAIINDNTSGDISAQDVRDVLVSVDGENSVQAGSFASIPSSGQKAGDLYVPSDGFSVYRWSGSAWVPWGPMFPLREPTLETWAWINQGSATVATTNGGIHLYSPSNGSAHGFRIRKKAAPSVPYTCTFVLLPMLGDGSEGSSLGVCFRQSSDGKLHTFEFAKVDTSTTNVTIFSRKWSDPTSYSADYKSVPMLPINSQCPALFVRLADDNTNRILSYSSDGRNFVAFHSVGRTDFLTANEIGFYVNPYAVECRETLLSYAEA